MMEYYNRQWVARIAFLSLLLCIFSLNTAKANNVFKQYMSMGQMFENSANLTMAEKYYTLAIDNYDRNNNRELTEAKLALAYINKFKNPSLAQRLNNQCMEESMKYADLKQKYLAINAFVNFCLNNKAEFEQANSEYIKLCQQNESLPDKYDLMLQSMEEAMKGFYDNSLATLKRSDADKITATDLRIIIFNMKGDMRAVIREQQNKASLVDSLNAESYEKNVNEKSLNQGLEKAREELSDKKNTLTTIIIIMAVVILILVGLYFYLIKKTHTYRKNKNEQLKTALKMAGEADEMKKDFVRRVSHEIRTPLNAITGFNDIINNTSIQIDQEERDELLARINENVKAITVIVDELLQAANAESIQDYAKYDIITCNKFLSNIISKRYSDVNSKTELKFNTKLLNRFSITTNAEALEKIIDHLIDNAIKFTQLGRIELACSEKDNMLYITVTDTGKGIPEDKQDEIFEQFAKADQFEQGIGLGLTVSKKMAQKLGGDLTLDKHYKIGARFILTVPVN